MQIEGTVAQWHAEQGWGVIASSETPGGCWVSFSAIVMDGYRTLDVGSSVTFTFEHVGQDGYDYRAIDVWPPGVDPHSPRPAPTNDPSGAYRSTLTIRLDDGRVLDDEGARQFIDDQ